MNQYIDVHYSHGDTNAKTKAQYQYNRGQILRIYGITKDALPGENGVTYVHFSVRGMNKPISKEAEFFVEYGKPNSEYLGVEIPSVLFTQKNSIVAYVYLSSQQTSQTIYKVEIPIIERPVPDGYDLDDEEMDDIERMILELRDATDKAEALSELTVSSETLEAEEESSAEVTEKGNVKNIHFGIPKGEAGGYYEPHVGYDGQLTWWPSKDDMPWPDSVNIRGPQGPQGMPGGTAELSTKRVEDGTRVMFMTKVPSHTGEMTTFQSFVVPDGERGDPGIVPVVLNTSGQEINIENSAEHQIQAMKIYGKTTQGATPTIDTPVDPMNLAESESMKIATVNKASSIVIKSQPADFTGPLESEMTFKIEAEGAGLSYQWQYSHNGGTNWADSFVSTVNQTTDTLTFPLKSWHDGYLIRCIVADVLGNVEYSSSALIKIGELPPIQITSQPAEAYASVGETVEFKVDATGTDLSYKWQWTDNKSGEEYIWNDSTAESSVSKTLLIEATSHRNGYQYRCVITDSNGNQVISEEVMLTVTEEPKAKISNAEISIANGLPGLKVDSNGNYTDLNGQQWIADSIEYDVNTKKYKYIQRIAKKRIQNDVTWQTAGTNVWRFFGNSSILLPDVDLTYVKGFLCTHFKYAEIAESKNLFQISASGNIGFAFIEKDATELTSSELISEFKNFITNNEVYMYYVLKTPVETELTDIDLSTLKTFHPNTHILNSEDAFMDIDYVADTKIYLDNRIDAIPAGPPGPKGDRGDQGPRGAQGLPGFIPIIENQTSSVIGVSDASECGLNNFTIYGKTTQDGTPTSDDPIIPNYIRTGNLSVKINGANIVDWANPYSRTSVTEFTSSEDGSEISVSGLKSYAHVLYELDPAALSGKTLYCSVGSYTSPQSGAKASVQLVYAVDSKKTYTGFLSSSKIITIPDNADRVYLQATCNNTSTDLESSNTLTFVNPMVTVIENVDEWSQYKLQSAPITVSEGGNENITIITQPKNVNASLDSIVVFNVMANGEGLTYKWELYNPSTSKWADSAATGANSNEITLKVQSHQNGFKYRCNITDVNGSTVQTIPAKLTIDDTKVKPVYSPTTRTGLHGLPVSTGGNYIDENGQQWVADTVEYDAETGLTKCTQRIRASILDGSEEWRRETTNENYIFSVYNLGFTKNVEGLCSHFSANTINSSNSRIGFSAKSSSSAIRFRPDDYATLTLDEWKARLAADPITVVYALAEPVVTYVSSERLAELHTYLPYTTISNNYGAAMRLEYIADTKEYVNKVQPGPQGEQGVQGTQGPQGVQGMPGVLPILETASGSILDLKGTANHPLQSIVVYGRTSTSNAPSVDNPATLINAVEDGEIGISTINKKPSITLRLNPANFEAAEGDTMSFKAEAEGMFLSYQWEYKIQDQDWIKSTQPGNTTSVISMIHRPYRDGYLYRCKITDAYGNVIYTNEATAYDGTSKTFRIIAQPADANVAANQMIKFKVEAEGEGLTYQWKYQTANNLVNWIDSVDEGCKTNEVSFVADSSYNGYKYYCQITDASGATLSSNIVNVVIGEDVSYESNKIEFSIPNKLSSVPVSSNGTYVDQNGQSRIADTIEYDAKTGITKYVQRVWYGRLTSTSHNWSTSSALVGRYNINNPTPALMRGVAPLCTSFIGNAGSTTEVGYVYNNSGTQLCFNTSFATIDEWKEYLDTNEVYVVYAMATPVETELTTVYMQNVKSFYPDTVVLNSDNAYMNVEYVLDTKEYVDNSIAAYEKYINDLIEAKIGVIENGTY